MINKSIINKIQQSNEEYNSLQKYQKIINLNTKII